MLNESLIIADQDTRNKIRDISRSFIVQAPAGSGKTECLVQRYLALLAQGVTEPEEIVAVTFTRKASLEMRARIITALELAQEPYPRANPVTWQLARRVLAQDHNYQWRLLMNPQRLRISTIDSLCSSLLKQMPLTLDSAIPLNVVENADLLYYETAEQLLHQLIHQGAVADELFALAQYFDNDLEQLRRLLVTMLKTRTYWQGYLLHQDLDQLTDYRMALVNYFYQEVAQNLQIAMPELLNLLHQIDCQDAIENAFWLELLTIHTEFDHQHWRLLARLLLTQRGEWRKKFDKSLGMPNGNANNKILKQLKDWIAAIQSEALLLKLRNINRCPAAKYSKIELEILSHILVLLPLAITELRKTFDTYQQMDFAELSLLTLMALNEVHGPTELALKLDYQIKHLLIDEFQDTSLIQYRLLCSLTSGWQPGDGRSIFLVGDPMQSIYRFREAEVSLFHNIQQYGLPNVPIEAVDLHLNFRSHPELIAWINQICQPLFPETHHPEYGEIRYTPSTSQQRPLNKPIIKHYFHTGVTQIATTIVALCQHHLTHEPQKKIAILIRSRYHVEDIIHQLRMHQLAFHLNDIQRHEDNPIIQDLIAFTCALTNPHDRIAWLACLRSPYIGLTLKEISIFFTDTEVPILLQCEAAHHPQLRRFMQIVQTLEPIKRQLPVVDWLETVWEAIGGYQIDTSAYYYETCRAYFMHLKTLDGMFNRTKILQSLTMLMIKSVTENAMIHILTIHKAKGLEFDTVIIPHCEKKTSLQNEPTLLNIMEWYHPQQRKHLLLMAPTNPASSIEPTLYDFIQYEEQQRNQAEVKRLFYVAITRAKTNLYFVSHIEPSSTFIPTKSSFLEFLAPFYQKEITACLEAETIVISQKSAPKADNKLHRIIFAEVQARQYKLYCSHHDHQFAGSSTPIETIIKQYLYQWSLVDQLSTELLGTSLANLRPICTQAGISTLELASAMHTIRAVLYNCVNDPLGQWILQQRDQAFSKYAIFYNKNIAYVDRIFYFKQELWIIDYKVIYETSCYTLEDLLLSDKNRLNEYAHALKTIFHHTNIRCGLYLPLQQELYSWSILTI